MEQHFAVSEDGILTHIKTAHDSPEDFYCPHCHCRMMKKCGDIRSWHFAHDFHNATENQKNCTNETYLHGYAKLRIKQWFDEAESIILYFTESAICQHYNDCKLKPSTEDCKITSFYTIDLKKVFTSCEIEQTVNVGNDKFRADLLLSGSDKVKQLLIEIYVTHECSERKKESDLPIIEFYITSEEDVEYIISQDIIECENVRFFGINITDKDKASKIKPKFDKIQKFILHPTGKSITIPHNCQDLFKRKGLFEVIFDHPTSTNIKGDDLFIYGLSLAREYGFDSKNCCICKHSTRKDRKNFCTKRDSFSRGSDALTCSSFQFKESLYLPPSISISDVWKKQT